MYVRRMYDVQMYDVRGGQSSIQAKRTHMGAFFLPSYINCTSYILPSYIYFTSYILPSYIFFAIFLFFSCIYAKKAVILHRQTKISVPFMVKKIVAS